MRLLAVIFLNHFQGFQRKYPQWLKNFTAFTAIFSFLVVFSCHFSTRVMAINVASKMITQ